jgi:hypothetical protein
MDQEDTFEISPQADEVLVAKKPVEVTAEDLADEEWGPVKDKGKKVKKGKGKKGKAQDESDNDEKPSMCILQIRQSF